VALNFNTFDSWIYNWIVPFTGLTTKWANQNGVKPDLPFLMMDKQTMTTVGHDITLPPDDNGFIVIASQKELVINFQAFGANSYGELDSIKALTNNPSSQDVLIENGISLVNYFPIQNLTQLVDNDYEERASMDLLFRFVIYYGENDEIESGLIKKVNIDATYKNANGTRTETINIDGTI
jgi:hypothetical protein